MKIYPILISLQRFPSQPAAIFSAPIAPRRPKFSSQQCHRRCGDPDLDPSFGIFRLLFDPFFWMVAIHDIIIHGWLLEIYEDGIDFHRIGCVWKCCVPQKNPMVLLIIIPMKNGYFIGNIPYFQTNPIIHIYIYIYTLWLFNIAIENGTSIVDLPIKNGDFPLLCSITRWYIYIYKRTLLNVFQRQNHGLFPFCSCHNVNPRSAVWQWKLMRLQPPKTMTLCPTWELPE